MIDPLEALIQSPEPIIRLKALTRALGLPRNDPRVSQAERDFNNSALVATLLSEVGDDGLIPHHPYAKWVGAHWVLACLADLAYPPGDQRLKPLLEQSYSWLLSKGHVKGIQTINGRVRRCASQEGNCVYYSMALGLADERNQELAERLIRWQWPDGGWNCDKHPEAINSSFNETLIPLRALVAYANVSGDPTASLAVERSVDVFLKRKLFLRQRDGRVIHPDVIKLHYPCYWHYDYLFGLKVMAEAGYIRDERCQLALDLLETRRLPDGGFPAQEKYYRVTDKPISGRSRLDWEGTSTLHMNSFVTLDALYVFRSAGRL